MNATIFLRTIKIICFLLLMCIQSSASAQDDFSGWWENDTLVAKSNGFAPENVANIGRARALARRAAMMDGYRQLAEQAKGIHITAETTIGEKIVAGDIVEGKVDAVVKGAKILSEEYDEFGNCTLVMAVPIYGVTDSVANVTFKPVDKENFPKPSAKIKSSGNYTGLIIDCGDSDITPVLSPVIRNAKNQSIYSYSNLDYEKVLANGMVGYAKLGTRNWEPGTSRPLSYAKLIENKLMLVTNVSVKNNLSRAGDNPLIITAESLSDGNSCPVVSISDADKILAENQASHFLDNGAVVFVSHRVGGVRA